MLNCIKMDLYRMFRMRSFYVIWIILIAATIFTTAMSVVDYNMVQEEIRQDPQAFEENADAEVEEPVNLGMTVTLPTQPGEKVTVVDQVYANLCGKFIALFLVIFTILFSTADISSGYIKNIGGQMRNRGNLVLSKATVLFFYTVLTMLLYLIVQTVAQVVFFHSLGFGAVKDFAAYLMTQTMLHYALVLICMAVSIIIRNNVCSMTLAILLCMNVLVIVYSAIDKAVGRIGVKDFALIRYTVTGKISLLSMAPTDHECMTALIIAISFGAAAVILSSQIFRKRDI